MPDDPKSQGPFAVVRNPAMRAQPVSGRDGWVGAPPNDPTNGAYFAPASDTVPSGPPVAHEGQAWGEDAEDIARAAGLGSYEATTLDQQAREDALLQNLERLDGEVRGLRAFAAWLAVCVVVNGAVLAWLAWRVVHAR